MRNAFVLVSLILLSIASLPLTADAAEVLSVGEHGLPTFIKGDLGQIDALGQTDPMAKSQDAELFRLSAKNFARDLMFTTFEATGLEDLVEKSTRVDSLGMVHVRFGQTINGIAVDGADLIIHADAATGAVYAANGLVLPATDKVALAPTVGPESSHRGFNKADTRFKGPADLAYVVNEKGDRAVLSWKRVVEYTDAEGLHRDMVYTDATSGAYVTRHPMIHTAKSWKTYSANNGSSLPGTLKCTNTGSCGESVAQAAHNNASSTYDYYSAKFGRDSLNGNGLTLTSTVHYSNNYNNAYWDGNQMVYGDGDGSVFSPLGNALDVVAHELTHGVTEYESGLIYQNESGALNEALSDIFSSAAEAWVDGSINANTWKLGEDIYTPGTSGDALRYMNNPTLDGSSYDYYPERYTGSGDNGGVHINSGIANLAFYLLVQGGTHPRNKTTNVVPGIGMAKVEQIFYRAQTNYLSASSNFQAARNATAQAATDLYGATEANAVQQAWCAVGVPGCPTGGGSSELSNNVAKTGQSGSAGSSTYYTITIPAGATNLVVTTSGGTGDPDLYVRFGSQPTTSTYTCRSWASGPTESCTIAAPSAGTYHVMVYGYTAYSGLSVKATWTTSGGGGSCGNSTTVSSISGSSGSTKSYTFAVASCASTATIKISGGTGDADLYVRFGSAPTTTTYTCRPYLNGNNETCTFTPPSTGTYYIQIRGYSTYSGVTLSNSYQ